MIRHVYGDRFPIGEPSGEITADVQRLSDVFVKAGMQAPVLDRIRDEIWLKLWGNVCLNPISALTHATLDVICSDPATRALSKAIMLETQTIAETFGVKFRVDVERRIEGARKVGAHKTSMLQDLERGRPMEIDPLVTVVQEMGRLTKIPTPALDAVLALVAQRAKIAGLYDGTVRPAETKAPPLHDGVAHDGSRHDLQRAAARQQDLARHDAVARRPDRLRHIGRCRRHEGAGQHGHRCDRRHRRADQRISPVGRVAPRDLCWNCPPRGKALAFA